MTSYQRRQREVAFYKQCLRELEDIARGIVKANPGCVIPLSGSGLSGDTVLTPYNTGGFEMELSLLVRKRAA